MINKTIIICSIVRNAEKGLKKNIPIIDALCKHFKDYRIVVYENNSVDLTKRILIKWQETNPDKIHVSINDTDSSPTIPTASSVHTNPFFSWKRIEKMSCLRNNYMEYVEQKGWKADYLMVVDLDVASLNLQGILSSFQTKDEWDVVTAFGYSTSPKLKRRYHDTYALTMWGDEDNPQTEQKIIRFADSLGNLKPTDKWVRVFSAFGGLAIYKHEAIKGLRYQTLLNEDKRIEVKCEHFSIYKQMVEKGFNRFYINPAMTLKYQALTLTIVWNSLKRKVGLYR